MRRENAERMSLRCISGFLELVAEFGASYHTVERHNPTLRMSQRRFTRRPNGFSSKLRNRLSAVALQPVHYNFCRVNRPL